MAAPAAPLCTDGRPVFESHTSTWLDLKSAVPLILRATSTPQTQTVLRRAYGLSQQQSLDLTAARIMHQQQAAQNRHLDWTRLKADLRKHAKNQGWATTAQNTYMQLNAAGHQYGTRSRDTALYAKNTILWTTRAMTDANSYRTDATKTVTPWARKTRQVRLAQQQAELAQQQAADAEAALNQANEELEQLQQDQQQSQATIQAADARARREKQRATAAKRAAEDMRAALVDANTELEAAMAERHQLEQAAEVARTEADRREEEAERQIRLREARYAEAARALQYQHAHINQLHSGGMQYFAQGLQLMQQEASNYQSRISQFNLGGALHPAQVAAAMPALMPAAMGGGILAPFASSEESGVQIVMDGDDDDDDADGAEGNGPYTTTMADSTIDGSCSDV